MKGRYPRGVVIAHRSITFMIAICLFAATSAAQDSRASSGVTSITPGSELEEYLRYLQITGAAPLAGWSIRELSIKQSAARMPTSANPWTDRFRSDSSVNSSIEWRLFPVGVTSFVNTAFPAGGNDGAVWAGRGLTVAADGGGMLRAGPIVLQLKPVIFWAQNAAYELQQNGQSGNGIFFTGQPQFATSIDFPQRFGDGGYSQVDWGDSELRAEFPWLMAGLSNAHRIWGPASLYPFILGKNAAGFRHAFVSTNAPVNLGIAHLRANVFWGELDQSDYSPVTGPAEYYSNIDPGTRRFASGLVLAFQPRGMPGVEVGVSRFLHSFWPRSGLPRQYATRVFQNFLKRSLRERDTDATSSAEASDNQLLSAFARWALPRGGAEFYAEYGREDHAYDFRDLISEPDHSRSYMLGARKILSSKQEVFSAIRFELINFQQPTTVRHRDEGGIYLHSVLRQGHTQRGQLLGAPVRPGAAAASTLAYDRYDQRGRTTLSWSRMVNQQAGLFWLVGVENPSASDVTHSLRADRLLFRGPVDLTASGTLEREFNRNFSSDALNISAALAARYYFR